VAQSEEDCIEVRRTSPKLVCKRSAGCKQMPEKGWQNVGGEMLSKERSYA
jgi:hypothetical protein